MTARPPRAQSRSEGAGKRARTRSDRDRSERVDRRRAASAVPSERFESIGDEDVLEVSDLGTPGALVAPGAPDRLRMLVLEAAPHLAAAQSAIVAAGHAVAIGAAGREGIPKLRLAIAQADAMLVGMPGGEPLIEAALACGPQRPIVITAWTADALEATRRAAAAGSDLATVRPHDPERLAPILFAAVRLAEQQRRWASAGAAVPAGSAAVPDEVDELAGLELDLDADPDPGGLLSAERFAEVAERELTRARRYGYPVAVAVFLLDTAAPPPAALRGILRARAGNALVHALRDIDLATELDHERFLVMMPCTERAAAGAVARRIISAVAAGDPVSAGGQSFPPRVIGAVSGAPSGGAPDLPRLVQDATQLLEQAQASGASLAVEA